MKKILAIIILLLLVVNPLLLMNTTYATHTAKVQWAKEEPADPSYTPHPGDGNEYYWNGYTPKWINFTVKNNGPDPIKEIKIIFKKDPDGNSYFNFTQTQQKTGWYATPDEFGPNKRPTVLYFRTDSPQNYIHEGETARFDIYMTRGPKNECSYNIDVWTIDAGTPAATNFHQLFILIDNHLPTVEIIFPQNGTIFQYQETVWVNATASDTEGLHPSGIKKVELWFTYIEKTGTSKPTFVGLMKYDKKNKVYWWKTKTKHLRDEAWHKAVAIAYDYAENKKESTPVMFFWYKPARPIDAYTIDQCFLYLEPVGHVNSTVKVKGKTGFLPNHEIIIFFDKQEVCRTKTDSFGAFSCTFHVPEATRGTHKVKATDDKITVETDFRVIPWVWVEPTEGYVGDKVTITGKGFAANKEMDVIYRDVSQGRYFDKWAAEWGNEGIKLQWKPYLDNLTVTPKKNPPTTNAKGTFTFKFNIPQSYGGYHPIYAEERKTKVRSGWMPDYPQAALFKVKTKIWTVPEIGLSGQFIQIFGEGLPLPKYIEKIYDCKTEKTTIQKHNYYLVLDFGPNKYWIYEKGFILNNEFDYAWFSKLYLPFAYHFPLDENQYPDPSSPVWNGKLCWQDADKQYHIGSPFLKVPALTPGEYDILMYQFDATSEKDIYKFEASTPFHVLKDPLYVRVNTGTLYFSGENVKVYTEIDLDGTATDPTSITFRLYRENTFIESLTPQKISTGVYTASFICPNEKGNYFIIVNATLSLDGFSLSGFGTASFTVSQTFDGFNATLTAINNNIASINTKIGQIELDLTDLDVRIESVEGDIEEGIAILSAGLAGTDLGTITAKLDSIIDEIIATGQNTLTIQTSIGNLQGTISEIQGKTATIETRVGTIYATIDSIKTETGLQPTNLALSLIAAISAIIAAILVFRKLYT